MQEDTTLSESHEINGNLVILSDEEDGMLPLYGHALAMQIQLTGKEQKVRVVAGIPYICYITYLYLHFPAGDGTGATGKRRRDGSSGSGRRGSSKVRLAGIRG
jgi:hypothetical protein